MSIDPGRAMQIEGLGDRLADAWTARTRLDAVSEAEKPASRAEAFHVQARMRAASVYQEEPKVPAEGPVLCLAAMRMLTGWLLPFWKQWRLK